MAELPHEILPLTRPIALAPLPERPLVSVVMANYNYGQYVGQAIESVLAQNYDRFEIIVVDDGSTDDSCDVVERYVCQNPRVRLLRKPNGGMASAWNLAAPHVKGDVLCLLDADDLFHPRKLERVIDAFRQSARSALLVHSMTVITGAGAVVQQVPFLSRFEQGWIADRVLKRGGRWRYMPTSSLCFRRELCPYIFPMDEKLFFSHAETFIVILCPLLTEVTAIEQSLTRYRVHGLNRTGGHAHDVKTAKRTAITVIETMQGVNARLATLGIEQRIDETRNLESLQANFILALLDGRPRLKLLRQFRTLSSALVADDMYGLAQKMLGLFVYGTAILLPAGQRGGWFQRTLGFSQIKQRVGKILGVIRRKLRSGGSAAPSDRSVVLDASVAEVAVR